jgi:hypothetical protein
MVNVSIKDELGPVLCLEGILFTTTGLISSEISFKLWQFRYNLLYKLNVMCLWNLFLNTKMGYRIVVKWKSEWLLFNAKLAIFQPYHGEYKLHVDEMMSTLYYTDRLWWIFMVLAHWNKHLLADMSLHSNTYTDSKPTSLCPCFLMVCASWGSRILFLIVLWLDQVSYGILNPMVNWPCMARARDLWYSRVAH